MDIVSHIFLGTVLRMLSFNVNIIPLPLAYSIQTYNSSKRILGHVQLFISIPHFACA